LQDSYSIDTPARTSVYYPGYSINRAHLPLSIERTVALYQLGVVSAAALSKQNLRGQDPTCSAQEPAEVSD